MNANELIANAYYLSGVVSRELETVTGSQMADGLVMLNDVLGEAAAKGVKIPYYAHSTFNAVVNQEEYYLEGILDVAELTFTNGNVRYSLRRCERDEYFGQGRVNNIATYPTIFTVERAVGGCKVYVYFVPDRTYEFQVTQKNFFPAVNLYTDLSTIFDRYYGLFLKYEIAKMICDNFDVPFSLSKMEKLKELRAEIYSVDPPDMSFVPNSYLDAPQSYNWAAVNLYRGLLP